MFMVIKKMDDSCQSKLRESAGIKVADSINSNVSKTPPYLLLIIQQFFDVVGVKEHLCCTYCHHVLTSRFFLDVGNEREPLVPQWFRFESCFGYRVYGFPVQDGQNPPINQLFCIEPISFQQLGKFIGVRVDC